MEKEASVTEVAQQIYAEMTKGERTRIPHLYGAALTGQRIRAHRPDWPTVTVLACLDEITQIHEMEIRNDPR